MKRFLIGLLAGILLMVGAVAVAADLPIRLVVDGRTLITDVQPQIIDGRVMIPARALAEALGATVEWDGEGRRVIVTTRDTRTSGKPAPTEPAGTWFPLQILSSKYGLAVTVPDPKIAMVRIEGHGHFVDVMKTTEQDYRGTSDLGIVVRGRLNDEGLSFSYEDLSAAGLLE